MLMSKYAFIRMNNLQDCNCNHLNIFCVLLLSEILQKSKLSNRAGVDGNSADHFFTSFFELNDFK